MDPSQTPFGTPPDGVTPNFVNPHSTGYIPRIGIYVSIPLMLFFLTLRIGTRVRLAHVLGPDDSMCSPLILLVFNRRSWFNNMVSVTCILAAVSIRRRNSSQVAATSACRILTRRPRTGLYYNILWSHFSLYVLNLDTASNEVRIESEYSPVIDLGNPLGRHLWDVPLSDLTDRFFQSALVSLIFSNLAIMFIKISLLLLYLRIFELFTWARTAIWSGLVATLVFYVTCDAVIVGVCVSSASQIPMELALTGDCVQAEVKTAFAAAWFGTIIDFYILAIPIRFISSLMLNKQRRIGVLAIFMTGLL